MATLQEVAVIVKRLADAYGSTPTDGQVRTYHTVLGGYDRMYLARAASKLIETSKFFPRPAELSAAIRAERERNAWRPPRDPFDEDCMWTCYKRGISPYQLTPADIEAAYATADNHR